MHETAWSMPHILVIDNDRSVGDAIQFMLENAGHSSVFAGDALAGLEAFGSSHFDLAFVDMLMPDLDGTETIRRMRETKPGLPIVAMSGFRLRNRATHADPLETAARLGAVCCLRKPFSQTDLLAAANLGGGLRTTAATLVNATGVISQ
jgi:CheY-like chemotaxis protein